MRTIYNELKENKNIRVNLSELRKNLKQEENRAIWEQIYDNDVTWLLSFLDSEDAKTRKNAALLIGDLGIQQAADELYAHYAKETTRFVRAAYVTALANLDVSDKLPQLEVQLYELSKMEQTSENSKHIQEEIRALRKVMIRYKGIVHHEFKPTKKNYRLLLITNKTQREFIHRTISIPNSKVHPIGVEIESEDLISVMQLRMYRELVFPIGGKDFISNNPLIAAEQLYQSNLMELLESLHEGEGAYYFRIECKSSMSLDERSDFSKKLSAKLERISEGKLINSPSDYEIEIRLIANREGKFFPCLKVFTIKDNRFAYRKNVIASSIHPSTAALIMELALPYLKKNAQIIDPFCGVGTMLIERDIKVPSKEKYATDIFGEAIEKGRENARFAGEKINFINRDFFDFKHQYKFDEIITNMPLKGKRTKEEMDVLYGRFFEKAKDILVSDGIIIMYTNEIGFVKKQLRLRNEFRLLQENCMQTKNEFYLLIIGYKG